MSKVSPLYPTNTIKVVAGDAQESPSLRNFNPRFGFAYRPFGEKTVFRGSYGVFTETLGRFARVLSNGPFQLSESFTNAIQNGRPLFAFPTPFPAGAGSVASQSITGYPANTTNGRIHQFNFSVERQIKDIGLRLSYVGARDRGMNYNVNINKPVASLIPFAQSRRPYPQFVGATIGKTDGALNYNAFSVEGRRRMGQFTFRCALDLDIQLPELSEHRGSLRPAAMEPRSVFFQVSRCGQRRLVHAVRPWQEVSD